MSPLALMWPDVNILPLALISPAVVMWPSLVSIGHHYLLHRQIVNILLQELED